MFIREHCKEFLPFLFFSIKQSKAAESNNLDDHADNITTLLQTTLDKLL